MKKIRCAIYTRKSAEEGLEQEFNSLALGGYWTTASPGLADIHHRQPAIIGPDWFDPTSPVPRLLGQGADRREPNSALDSSTGGSWFSRGRFILRRTERESKQVAHTKPLHINPNRK